MSRESYEVREGDKIWPIIQIILNTHYDDLTEERVEEIVALIDSWRITDANGQLLVREPKLSQELVFDENGDYKGISGKTT